MPIPLARARVGPVVAKLIRARPSRGLDIFRYALDFVVPASKEWGSLRPSFLFECLLGSFGNHN